MFLDDLEQPNIILKIEEQKEHEQILPTDQDLAMKSQMPKDKIVNFP